MSGTNTTTTPAAAQAPDPLITPQSIIAFMGMAIMGATLAAVLYLGDGQLRAQALTGALGLGTMVAGYYFGSSTGSKGKDAAIVSLAGNQAPSTTTVEPGKTVTEIKPVQGA